MAPTINPGPDPTPNDASGRCVGCASYGGGEALVDPDARIHILDAVAPGGDSNEVTITVAFSSSSSVAGFRGTIDIAEGPLGSFGPGSAPAVDLTDADAALVRASAPRQGELQFGYLRLAFNNGDDLDAGDATPVIELTACIEAGTPAGEYPIELIIGEIVDGQSGRTIVPELVGGTVTVQEDVSVDAPECFEGPVPTECLQQEGRPEDLIARFELGNATTVPGGSFEIPFTVSTNADAQGVVFSIDFDEEVLQCDSVTPVYEKPDGTDYGFWSSRCVNTNEIPGNGGTDEGYVIGAAVFSFLDNCNNIPAGEDTEAFRLAFSVADDTTAQSTEVSFLDGGHQPPDGPPIENGLTAFGERIMTKTAGSFVLLGASVAILPDGSVFIRGDANRDEKVDISDARRILGFLFLGTESLTCRDAADANDGRYARYLRRHCRPPVPLHRRRRVAAARGRSRNGSDTLTCLGGP